MLGAAVWAVAPAAAALGGLEPLGVALTIAFLVLSLGIHEAAHAWAAWRCGDSTAKDLGRMTLNPIPHIDPFMTVLIPAILAITGLPIFGGAKPVPVNYHRLRHPLRDMALVALAGPASNFLLALVFGIAHSVAVGGGHYAQDSLLAQVLGASMFANVMLMVFNLLPIPPLDGSRVMTWLLPASMRAGYMAIESIGIILVLLLFQIDALRTLLWRANLSVLNLIDQLTSVFA